MVRRKTRVFEFRSKIIKTFTLGLLSFVLFFSNTRKVAAVITDGTNAKLFETMPQKLEKARELAGEMRNLLSSKGVDSQSEPFIRQAYLIFQQLDSLKYSSDQDPRIQKNKAAVATLSFLLTIPIPLALLTALVHSAADKDIELVIGGFGGILAFAATAFPIAFHGNVKKWYAKQLPDFLFRGSNGLIENEFWNYLKLNGYNFGKSQRARQLILKSLTEKRLIATGASRRELIQLRSEIIEKLEEARDLHFRDPLRLDQLKDLESKVPTEMSSYFSSKKSLVLTLKLLEKRLGIILADTKTKMLDQKTDLLQAEDYTVPIPANAVSGSIFKKMVEQKQIPLQLMDLQHHVSSINKTLVGEFRPSEFRETPDDLSRGILDVELILKVMDPENGKTEDAFTIPFQILTDKPNKQSALLAGDWFLALAQELDKKSANLSRQYEDQNVLNSANKAKSCPDALSSVATTRPKIAQQQ
ncbi:MAG: hypothetical protein JWQ35_1476 [Bacteriovoracaceae bacterium]|nr:hypothetical protein [Bacteriovoracaceae bacterium]